MSTGCGERVDVIAHPLIQALDQRSGKLMADDVIRRLLTSSRSAALQHSNRSIIGQYASFTGLRPATQEKRGDASAPKDGRRSLVMSFMAKPSAVATSDAGGALMSRGREPFGNDDVAAGGAPD